MVAVLDNRSCNRDNAEEQEKEMKIDQGSGLFHTKPRWPHLINSFSYSYCSRYKHFLFNLC